MLTVREALDVLPEDTYASVGQVVEPEELFFIIIFGFFMLS